MAATPEPEEAPGAATSAEPVFVEAGTNNSLGGFDTISVDLGGVVTLHRSELGHTHGRRATIRLSPEQLFAITDAIDSDQLYWFGGSYHAGRELGEPMFTLRLINGDTETAIFCDDACPRRVYAFYQELNRIVEEAGRDGYGWRSVPGSGHGDALLEAGRRAQRNPRRLNDPRLWR